VADQFAKSLKRGRFVNEQEALNPIMRAEIQEEGDFVIDEKAKTVTLTQQGVQKAERFFAVTNLSDPDHMEIQHHVNNALKANYNMQLDVDYVKKRRRNHYRGRVYRAAYAGAALFRRLAPPIEAKEKVKVNRESKTLATITFQNFFNKYTKKAGTTGTATPPTCR